MWLLGHPFHTYQQRCCTGATIHMTHPYVYSSTKASFMVEQLSTQANKSSTRWTIAGAIFAVLGLGSIIGATKAILFRLEHPILVSNIQPWRAPSSCQRRPLPFSPPRDSNSYINRKYTHFDDVLLIVFFSHARYDTNLDSYHDVYSEYFPNVMPPPLYTPRPIILTYPFQLKHRSYSLAQRAARTPGLTTRSTCSWTRSTQQKT